MILRALLLTILVLGFSASPASAQPIGVDEVLGEWFAENDPDLVVTIEREGRQIRVRASHAWSPMDPPRSPAAPLVLTFTRAPQADEMDPAAPEWARRAVEGRLRWELEFSFARRAGRIVATARFYPGELVWREEKEGERIIRRQADARGRGTPLVSVFVRLEVTRVRITGFDPGRSLSRAITTQFFRAVAQVDAPPRVGPERLKAEVVNAQTGQRAEVELTRWGTDGKLYVSEPVLVAAPGARSNPPFVEVAACAGERLTLRLAAKTADLDVASGDDTLFPVPCTAPPPPPKFTLQALGPTTITWDPETERSEGLLTSISPRDVRGATLPRPPTVVLKDEAGRPIANEGIVWLIPWTGESYLTYTDERGAARLDFRVADRGRFIVVIDDLPTGSAFVDGTHQLMAMPTDPVMASLVQGGPVRFELDLVRPTTIDIIERSGRRLPVLIAGQNFFVQVFLGRRDTQQFGGTRELSVRIDPPIRLRTPLTMPVVRGAARVWESQTRFRLRTEASFFAPFEPGLKVNDGDRVTVSFSLAAVSVQIWASELRLAEVRMREALQFWRQTANLVAAAPNQSADDRRRAQTLDALAAGGLGWLDDTNVPLSYRVAAAAVYVELIQGDLDQLDLLAAPASVQFFGSAPHRVIAGRERQRLEAAMQEAHAPDTIGARLSRIGSGFVDFVVSLPDMLFVSPFIGLYTAVSGWTAEGEVATVFERVIGGFEAAAALAEAPGAVLGAATRIGSFARSATKAAVRTTVAEGVLAGTRSMARVLGAQAGEAAARIAPEYLVEAATEIATLSLQEFGGGDESRHESPEPWRPVFVQLEDDDASPFVPAVHRGRVHRRNRIEMLRSTLERRQRYMLERLNDLGDADRRVDVLKRELDGLRRQPAAAARNRRMAEVSGELKRVEQRIQVLERRFETHREIWERARRSLNRLEGISLSSDDLERLIKSGKRPHSKDYISGTKAEAHYEQQVQRELAAEGFGTDIAREGIEIETAYQSPLGREFRGGAPADLDDLRRPVKKPKTPDHINPTTLDAADSKYYDFAGVSTPEAAAKVAAELADTVEKTRLVQAQIIRNRLTREAQAAGRELTDEVRAEIREAAVKEARTKKVYIITPEPVPASVQDFLRRLGTDPALILVCVVQADLASWIDPGVPRPPRPPLAQRCR